VQTWNDSRIYYNKAVQLTVRVFRIGNKMAIVAPFRQCIWMRNIAVTVLLGEATNMYI